jgi:hypothetical protein
VGEEMDGQLGRGLDGRDEFLRGDPREGQHSQSGGSSSVFEQIYTRLPLLSCQMFSPMMNDDSFRDDYSEPDLVARV